MRGTDLFARHLTGSPMSATLHHEKPFEDAIRDDLAAAGWLYDPGDVSRYDRERALFLPDLIAFCGQPERSDDDQPARWRGNPFSPLQLQARRIGETAHFQQQRKGLFRNSAATVVSGPWPGKTRVSGGNDAR